MATITGTTGDDNDLRGTSAADVIRGLAGHDYLTGMEGDDRVEGGDGNDDIAGYTGDDLLYGGLGNDWLFESGHGANDKLFGEAGDDELRYSADFDSLAYTALLDGGVGDDVLEYYSNGTNDTGTLRGGAGRDFVMALGGALHTIDAGADADLVWLGLSGARSEVTLGSGADLLYLYGYPEQIPASIRIRVADFQPGNAGDGLSLTQYLTMMLQGWDQTANPFATGHLRLIQRGADAVLQADRDGAGSEAAFGDLVVFAGISRTALTAHNLGGYAANGSVTAGRTLTGSASRDFLTGDSGDDLVVGLAGNDFLRGGVGDDRLEGGDGIDQLDGELGADLLLAGGGNDALSDTLGGWDRLFGEAGDDNVSVDRQSLSPSRPLDNLYLDGGTGDDYVSYYGGAARDNVRLVGGADNDTIVAYRGGRVVVDAGDGADIVQLDVTAPDYEISLGNGSDILRPLFYDQGALTAFTVLDFTPGNGGDQIDLDGFAQAAFTGWAPATNPFGTYLKLGKSGADSVLLVDRDGAGGGSFELFGTLKNVDPAKLTAVNLTWAPGAVVKAGTNAANTLAGTAATDEIFGLGGNDVITGGGAGDRLDGGLGADRLEGGVGNDLYFVDNVLDKVVETSGAGTDTVHSSASSFTLAGHVENLRLIGNGEIAGAGNTLANVITGNGARNALSGLDGNDRLDGGGDADTMAGGKDHDTYVVDNVFDQVVEAGSNGTDTVLSSVSYALPTHVEKLVLTGTSGIDGRGNSAANTITGNAGGNFLNGGSGNDVIDGGAGNDRIVGALGNDTLKGGAGLDRFEFTGAPGSANVDKILDFWAPSDSLYLMRSAFAAAGANGTLAASAFRQGSAAADASDRIVYDSATGNIFYDSDGSGAAAAILFATVTPGTALTNADFVIFG